MESWDHFNRSGEWASTACLGPVVEAEHCEVDEQAGRANGSDTACLEACMAWCTEQSGDRLAMTAGLGRSTYKYQSVVMVTMELQMTSPHTCKAPDAARHNSCRVCSPRFRSKKES